MNESLSELVKQLTKDKKVVIDTKVITPEVNQAMVSLFTSLLAQNDLLFLQHLLYTLFKELCNNASKANQKRVYFASQKADINDTTAYAELMKSFKSEVIENRAHYDNLAYDFPYSIQITIDQSGDKIVLSVFNNAEITQEELRRIHERINKVKEGLQLSDVFNEVADDSEGAGLGLVLNLILLKNSGIGIENFIIEGNSGGTLVTLQIPKLLHKPEAILEMERLIFHELSSVPTFSETINNIIRLCDDPDSQISLIVKEIGKDPSLASNILKLANSSSFVTAERTDTLQKAATKIGLKGIKEMTMAVAADRILNEKYKQLRGFWEHCHQCARYAKQIARETGQRKHEDTIYLGGLLHDIGKLVLYAIDPTKIEGLEKFLLDRNRSSSALLEEITMGISHTEIGALLAQKWNFSDIITECIRDHHFPGRSKEEYRKAVSAVSVANSFVNIENRRSDYAYIDLTARYALNVVDEEKLKKLHEKVKAA